jgi:hypothetical protein
VFISVKHSARARRRRRREEKGEKRERVGGRERKGRIKQQRVYVQRLRRSNSKVKIIINSEWIMSEQEIQKSRVSNEMDLTAQLTSHTNLVQTI